MTTLTDFLARGRGVAVAAADARELSSATASSSPRLVTVRGSRMRTKAALLDEMSAALQFPLDFGANWDALADCLGDVTGTGGARAVVIVIAQAEQVLRDEADALPTFLAVLDDRDVHAVLPIAAAGVRAAVQAAWAESGLAVGAVE